MQGQIQRLFKTRWTSNMRWKPLSMLWSRPLWVSNEIGTLAEEAIEIVSQYLNSASPKVSLAGFLFFCCSPMPLPLFAPVSSSSRCLASSALLGWSCISGKSEGVSSTKRTGEVQAWCSQYWWRSVLSLFAEKVWCNHVTVLENCTCAFDNVIDHSEKLGEAMDRVTEDTNQNQLCIFKNYQNCGGFCQSGSLTGANRWAGWYKHSNQGSWIHIVVECFGLQSQSSGCGDARKCRSVQRLSQTVGCCRKKVREDFRGVE